MVSHSVNVFRQEVSRKTFEKDFADIWKSGEKVFGTFDKMTSRLPHPHRRSKSDVEIELDFGPAGDHGGHEADESYSDRKETQNNYNSENYEVVEKETLKAKS